MRRFLLSLPLLALLPACAVQPASQAFLVFFEPWSVKLDEQGRAAIDGAAELARKSPAAVVRVVGFADPEGSAAANIELSRLRAQLVVDELVKAGVTQSRIRQSGRGPTDFTHSGLESRRVEITIGGT